MNMQVNFVGSVSSAVTAVWNKVKWLGHSIRNISGGALGTGKVGVLKVVDFIKKIWGYIQPLFGKAFNMIKSNIGLFSTAMGASAFFINRSYSMQNPVHRVAFGILGLSCAVTAGAIASQAGIIPAFLA